MRFIPTWLHGLADYAVSVLVAALPPLFALTGPLSWIFPLLGAFGITYSLVTQYELSLARLLPMPLHLALDTAFGLIMLAIAAIAPLSPIALAVTLGIGLLALLLAATTKLSPGREAP